MFPELLTMKVGEWKQKKDDLVRFELIYHVEALDELHKINIYSDDRIRLKKIF